MTSLALKTPVDQGKLKRQIEWNTEKEDALMIQMFKSIASGGGSLPVADLATMFGVDVQDIELRIKLIANRMLLEYQLSVDAIPDAMIGLVGNHMMTTSSSWQPVLSSMEAKRRKVSLEKGLGNISRLVDENITVMRQGLQTIGEAHDEIQRLLSKKK